MREIFIQLSTMSEKSIKSYDDLRQNILEEINSTFKKKVNDEIKALSNEKPLPPEVAKEVSAKFQQKFSNYLATAFDIVIGNDMVSNLTANNKESTKNSDDQHNLSVTNEQLQEMDNSIIKVARRRKEYPKKCTKYLEKTLEFQGKAAEKIKVNIDNVELLDDPDVPEILPNCHDLQEKLNDLQSSVRKQIQKSVRIESSLRILEDSVPYESNLHDD